LNADEWLSVILAGVMVFSFAELEKTVIRNFKRRRTHAPQEPERHLDA
jgi:hypothetical protein